MKKFNDELVDKMFSSLISCFGIVHRIKNFFQSLIEVLIPLGNIQQPFFKLFVFDVCVAFFVEG